MSLDNKNANSCKEILTMLSFFRRTYGRAPKMIHLEANFVQFKEELLPKEGNKALLTFPFLHIYWTDCCVSNLKAKAHAHTHKASVIQTSMLQLTAH